jgi:hypothetical protein
LLSRRILPADVAEGRACCQLAPLHGGGPRARRYPSDTTDAQGALIDPPLPDPAWPAGEGRPPRGAPPPRERGRHLPCVLCGRQRPRVARAARGFPALVQGSTTTSPPGKPPASPRTSSTGCVLAPGSAKAVSRRPRRRSSTPPRSKPPRRWARRAGATTPARRSTGAGATSPSTLSGCCCACWSPPPQPRTARPPRRCWHDCAPGFAGSGWSGPTAAMPAHCSTGRSPGSRSPLGIVKRSEEMAGFVVLPRPLGRRAHPGLDHPTPPLRARLRTPPGPPRGHGRLEHDPHHQPPPR